MNEAVLMNLFQDVVLLAVFIGTLRQLIRGKRSLRMTFFAFAIASGLLSDLYWLTYDILRPETRMPFAANEIGEWAMFLLLGAALGTKPVKRSTTLEKLFVPVFMAANVALWIAWSGEWIEDIITGAAMGYFIYHLAAQCKQEKAFHGWEWRLYGIACMALIAAQASIFFAPEPLRHPLDLFCYILMFSVSAFLFVRMLLSFRHTDRPSVSVCRAFAVFAWTLIAMYMSADVFYTIAYVTVTVCFPFLLWALIKEESL
ncbi:MAG: hypothetical protein K5678_01205 [Acetatifactor sp.]|nr:hypothetical protein [Acetatifactor sp.]